MKTQITKSIRPELNHRYVISSDFPRIENLTDSVDLMTSRAIGVLNLLSTQFESEDSNTLCNKSIYLAIDSVINEIQDIQEYLKAFSDAQHQLFDVADYFNSLNAKNPR